MYSRLVPLIGSGKPPSRLPPKPVLKLVTHLHPAFRRRNKQAEAALAGRDIVARAKTGTGKTAAFSIPILDRIKGDAGFTQAVILAPVRELANQIAEECEALAAHLGIHVALLVGGTAMGPQEKALEAGAGFIELDVQLSKERVPVLYHDSDTERISGVGGSLFDLTLSELMELDAYFPERFGETYRGNPIMTLSDFCDLMKRWPGTRFFVEIKRESIDHFGLEETVLVKGAMRMERDRRKVLRAKQVRFTAHILLALLLRNAVKVLVKLFYLLGSFSCDALLRLGRK